MSSNNQVRYFVSYNLRCLLNKIFIKIVVFVVFISTIKTWNAIQFGMYHNSIFGHIVL